MATLDEAQLVTRSIGGDKDAFTELVRRYRDAVYGYCYHRTGSFEDARDLAQETFIRAYARLRQLRDPACFGAWARKIAANLCTRWAESRRETPVEEIVLRQAQDERPLESPRTAVVKEALSSLPENERLAVVLHYVNGYSYGDIAGFLEVTKDAVRGRLYRGRETLKAEVLKMTRDTFEENRLDEKFVIESVNAAVREAHDAYNVLMDKEQSRKKVDEARALVERLELNEAEDPVALGNALLGLGMREQILREREQVEAHLSQARSLFEKAGNRDGIEECRAVVAYDRLGAGDLAGAHKLYSEIEDYWRGRRSEEGVSARCGYLAAKLALESLGLDADWSLVAAFQAGDCAFQREDGQILVSGGFHLGFNKDSYPARLRAVPSPPPGPTPLPLVLIRTEPEVGDTLRFVNYEGRSEESVLESLSETVHTPAGKFTNCARSSSRVFAPGVSGFQSDQAQQAARTRNPETPGADAVATRKLWLAPGVGLVRMAYQSGDYPEDTSELVAYHIEEQSQHYVPLATGNWWKWRWVEAEEELGFRTESYKEIVTQQSDTFVAIQYFFCVSEG